MDVPPLSEIETLGPYELICDDGWKYKTNPKTKHSTRDHVINLINDYE